MHIFRRLRSERTHLEQENVFLKVINIKFRWLRPTPRLLQGSSFRWELSKLKNPSYHCPLFLWTVSNRLKIFWGRWESHLERVWVFESTKESRLRQIDEQGRGWWLRPKLRHIEALLRDSAKLKGPWCMMHGVRRVLYITYVVRRSEFFCVTFKL